VHKALKARNSKIEEEDKGEFVVLRDELFKEIRDTNFFSSKIVLYLTHDRETRQRSLLPSKEGC